MDEKRCELMREILDPKLQAELIRVYEESFAEAKRLCIQEQVCYSREEFISALEDPEYVKTVLFEGNVVAGLLIGTANLQKARIAYVNPERLESAFPHRKGRIYYFTAVVVLPGHRKAQNALELVTVMTRFIDENDSMVAFDFSAEKNPELPKLIVAAAHEAIRRGWVTFNNAEYTELGGQRYGAIDPKRV